MFKLVNDYLTQHTDVIAKHTKMWVIFSAKSGLKLKKIPQAIERIDCIKLDAAQSALEALYASNKKIKQLDAYKAYLEVKHLMQSEILLLKYRFKKRIADELGLTLSIGEFESLMNACQNLSDLGALTEEVIGGILNKLKSKHENIELIEQEVTTIEGDTIDVLYQVKQLCKSLDVDIGAVRLPPKIASAMRIVHLRSQRAS